MAAWVVAVEEMKRDGTDKRVIKNLQGWMEKVQARNSAEQCLQILKEHATHVMFEGLRELDKR